MQNKEILKYSVIVPIYNEKESILDLHKRIYQVMQEINQSFEIIFVDDGSSDGTFGIIKKLSPLKIIRFRKNFGQTQALDAGIKESRGEVIITLDGDGQNPPEEIPKLLEKLEEGYDVVSGWRYPRHDPFAKKLFSKGAEYLRSFLIKDSIHDSGCTLKVYKRECFEDLDLYGEMHRFIPAILRWQGFKITEVKVKHESRKYGKSKYNWKRIVRGFIDAWSVWFWRKYSSRPLHLFGGLGILIGGLGSLILFYLAIGRLLGYFTLSNRIWPIIAVFMILAGLQLFISGLLADIAVKTYYNSKRKSYNIKEIIENK
jgi:glycosyltransferase involved in cell wall biosynthesis